ncbi:putative Chromo-like domain superfamily protein [Helianthus annuus]|nr:putative Chromo-like domain superfamily protein [Helianthus annuus]
MVGEERQVLVSWKGRSVEEATWESHGDFQLIQASSQNWLVDPTIDPKGCLEGPHGSWIDAAGGGLVQLARVYFLHK